MTRRYLSRQVCALQLCAHLTLREELVTLVGLQERDLRVALHVGGTVDLRSAGPDEDVHADQDDPDDDCHAYGIRRSGERHADEHTVADPTSENGLRLAVTRVARSRPLPLNPWPAVW